MDPRISRHGGRKTNNLFTSHGLEEVLAARVAQECTVHRRALLNDEQYNQEVGMMPQLLNDEQYNQEVDMDVATAQ
jgi:hypothetical protein